MDPDQDPDPDPLVRGTYPGIRIRNEMSRILSTDIKISFFRTENVEKYLFFSRVSAPFLIALTGRHPENPAP